MRIQRTTAIYLSVLGPHPPQVRSATELRVVDKLRVNTRSPQISTSNLPPTPLPGNLSPGVKIGMVPNRSFCGTRAKVLHSRLKRNHGIVYRAAFLQRRKALGRRSLRGFACGQEKMREAEPDSAPAGVGGEKNRERPRMRRQR